MEIAYIGLGKMGLNMVTRLVKKGHKVHAFDVDTKARLRAQKKGAKIYDNLQDLLGSVKGRKTVWVMVPHQFVDQVIKEILPNLNNGDVVIDGGNSFYKQSIKRAKKLAKKGVKYLDVGVSGGPVGALNGACMMAGGEKRTYALYYQLWKDLCVKDGFGYMGPSGAGHFVKMVHNGIEYGMMQAFAEGFDIMRKKKALKVDLKEVARVYNHGSVIESRLVGWMGAGYKKFGTDLIKVSGSAIGTGEGKWTVEEAKRLRLPASVLKEAYLARLRSMKKPNYQGKVIMTLRNQFGGHDANPEK